MHFRSNLIVSRVEWISFENLTFSLTFIIGQRQFRNESELSIFFSNSSVHFKLIKNSFSNYHGDFFFRPRHFRLANPPNTRDVATSNLGSSPAHFLSGLTYIYPSVTGVSVTWHLFVFAPICRVGVISSARNRINFNSIARYKYCCVGPGWMLVSIFPNINV